MQLHFAPYLYSYMRHSSVSNLNLLRNDAHHWSIKKIAIASFGVSLELTSCILATGTVALTCFYAITGSPATIPSLACVLSSLGYVNHGHVTSFRAVLILSRVLAIACVACAIFDGMALGAIAVSLMASTIPPAYSYIASKLSTFCFEYLKAHSNVALYGEQELLDCIEQPIQYGIPAGIWSAQERQRQAAVIELLKLNSEKKKVQARLLTEIARLPAAVIHIIQAYESPLKPIIGQFVQKHRRFLNQNLRNTLLDYVCEQNATLADEIEEQVRLIVGLSSSFKLGRFDGIIFVDQPPQPPGVRLKRFFSVHSLPARANHWSNYLMPAPEKETLSALQELYKFHQKKGNYLEQMAIIKNCFKFMLALPTSQFGCSYFSLKVVIELHSKGALVSDASFDALGNVLFDAELFSDLFLKHYVCKKVKEMDHAVLDDIFQTLLTAWNSKEQINRLRDEVIMDVLSG